MVTPRSKPQHLSLTLQGEEGPLETENFRLSASGIEFVVQRPLRLFQLLELELDLPAPDSVCGRFVCSGVVVLCEALPDRDAYKAGLLFLDLPECARRHIQASL